MKLADKFAVITGASQGLGLAIARRFVREGASVLLCVRVLQGRARLEPLRPVPGSRQHCSERFAISGQPR
jgi:NAD(P)-dependent dehydrogenase (short-subunit alcohol dehydrogenase family)